MIDRWTEKHTDIYIYIDNQTDKIIDRSTEKHTDIYILIMIQTK